MIAQFKIIILLLMLLGISSIAQTFSADSKDRRNQASFISDAPFENIIGVSSGLDVFVEINLEDITKMPKGKVIVSISNIKTGIALRDEHLTSKKWLDAENFPFAQFQLTEIRNPTVKKLTDSKEISATLVGKFTLHGKTNKIEAEATLTYFKKSELTKGKAMGNLLAVNASFNIKLSDFNVKIPSMIIGKVSEDVRIEVHFVVSDSHSQL